MATTNVKISNWKRERLASPFVSLTSALRSILSFQMNQMIVPARKEINPQTTQPQTVVINALMLVAPDPLSGFSIQSEPCPRRKSRCFRQRRRATWRQHQADSRLLT